MILLYCGIERKTSSEGTRRVIGGEEGDGGGTSVLSSPVWRRRW